MDTLASTKYEHLGLYNCEKNACNSLDDIRQTFVRAESPRSKKITKIIAVKLSNFLAFQSIRIIQVLQESLKYPWYLVEYKDVESVFDWFVMSAEPSVVLKIPSEHETIDSCVLSLLKTASHIEGFLKDVQNVQKTVVIAKQMAYVRSIVRLLKACDAKLHQLMATKQGQEMFNESCMSLLNSIETCTEKNALTMDATNLLLPIVEGMAVPESTSKLFAGAIEVWQTTSQTGNALLSKTLVALSYNRQWNISKFQVLESTLSNYMRVSGGYLSFLLLFQTIIFSLKISFSARTHSIVGPRTSILWDDSGQLRASSAAHQQ